MKVINVELTIKPEMKAEYEKFIAELVVQSAAEQGNLSYAHFRKLSTAYDYEIIEHWKDQSAITAHNKTPHFKKFLDQIEKYLAKPLVILRMEYTE